jgi:hypothetical protein
MQEGIGWNGGSKFQTLWADIKSIGWSNLDDALPGVKPEDRLGGEK